MKILLTGATGFLGSHVLAGLLREGHEVAVLKRSFSNCWRIKKELERCAAFDVDMLSISEIFQKSEPEVVIHCATNYGKGTETKTVMESNLVFPSELLEQAISYKCRCFINTDTFFTKQLPERLRHHKKLFRADYTLSKYQFREWGHLRAVEGKISFINLQMEHIYGPNDDPSSKFYPFLIQTMRDGKKSVDITKGIQIRDYIYVDYAVGAYLTILKHLDELEGFHSFEVGTGVSHTLRELAEKIRADLESDIELNFGAAPCSDAEIMYSTAQPEPLLKLGWKVEDLLEIEENQEHSGGGGKCSKQSKVFRIDWIVDNKQEL